MRELQYTKGREKLHSFKTQKANRLCLRSAKQSLKTLACLFKAQITRRLPAAQRFALLALLEKKFTRACKLQAQIKRRAFITKKK
ncbi:hypothetical protein J6590_063560 [Homalodisca vitripennis]|nr:hypothetical protein J6590_063560 [Homalodisca vitripennis]